MIKDLAWVNVLSWQERCNGWGRDDRPTHGSVYNRRKTQLVVPCGHILVWIVLGKGIVHRA